MNRSDPEWYEDLKKEPFRTGMFTERIAGRIREDAHRIRAKGSLESKRKFASGGAVLAAMAGVVLIAVALLANDRWISDRADRETLLSPAESSVDHPSVQTGMPDELGPPVVEVLRTVRTEEKAIVFKRETYAYKEHRSVRLVADFYEGGEKETDADKPQGSVAFSVLFENGEAPEERIFSGNFGKGGQLVSVGMLFDPQISRVRAVEWETGAVHDAEIAAGADGNRYWSVFVPYSRQGYRLEGLNDRGEVVADAAEFE